MLGNPMPTWCRRISAVGGDGRHEIPHVQAAETERHAELPTGAGKGFTGYGVMSLPFASGHVLALRRFPASYIGPAYTSVWHRDPAGR
jgi:hypothetical protein